ncbi:Smr/MutS family protein [Neisseria sp. S1]|uniref:Smr/MutS family protein n=1 Tax=Neisseria sp. S1 TaxID=3318354 RepID=UPI003A836DDA
MVQDFQEALKQLGKQAKQAAEERAKVEAEAKRKAAEEISFAQAVGGGVVPLKNTNRYMPPRDTSPIKPRQKQDTGLSQEDYFYVGDSLYEDDVPPTFSKNGQGKNDIRRLQSGHWPVVADVDLHGYTQEEAQQVLNEFIEFLAARGVCGEIVHGSGLGSSGYKPRLKMLVRRWLMAHPDVLAYAEPHKGNDGAVRILIRRRNRHQEG